tara:strand:+ start:12414 stop:12704 length:291 start_codon:yes stop_codon:yes gene_type:complete
MNITVLHNQSLLDIAIQYTGRAENYLKIAMANDVVPTEPIAPGTILVIPEDIEKDEQIVNYYKANNIQPATALSADLLEENKELSFWEKIINAFKF